MENPYVENTKSEENINHSSYNNPFVNRNPIKIKRNNITCRETHKLNNILCVQESI